MEQINAIMKVINKPVHCVIDDDGGKWYSVKDIAEGLGYCQNIVKKSCNLIDDVPPEYRQKFYIIETDIDGRKYSHKMNCLSEEGVTMLMLQSKKEKALKFQKYIANFVTSTFIVTWTKKCVSENT